MAGQNHKAYMYLDLAEGRPPTKIYRHKTHHFAAAEQDSESKNDSRERAGQKLIQDNLGLMFPETPRAGQPQRPV